MDEKEKQLTHFVSSYWDYFLELENEFASTQKYVAFDMCNKNTYSIEYLKLFQAVCSEIDVLGKEILLHFEPNFKVKGNTTITHWGYGVTQYMRHSLLATVTFMDKVSLNPWVKFGCESYIKKVPDKKDATCYRLETNCAYPTWWSDYNKVKHARTSCDEEGRVNYQRASFGNLILAFAALFALEQHYMGVLMKEADVYYPARDSQLFALEYTGPNTEIETSLAGAI